MRAKIRDGWCNEDTGVDGVQLYPLFVLDADCHSNGCYHLGILCLHLSY